MTQRNSSMLIPLSAALMAIIFWIQKRIPIPWTCTSPLATLSLHPWRRQNPPYLRPIFRLPQHLHSLQWAKHSSEIYLIDKWTILYFTGHATNDTALEITQDQYGEIYPESRDTAFAEQNRKSLRDCHKDRGSKASEGLHWERQFGHQPSQEYRQMVVFYQLMPRPGINPCPNTYSHCPVHRSKQSKEKRVMCPDITDIRKMTL